LRTEIFFLASQGMKDFFDARTDDKRSELLDFVDNDVSILPDGRTQKYRGEVTKDNPAYILRIAELYLIAAEAKKLAGGGLGYLNTLRENRGMTDLLTGDVPDEESFLQAVLDERLAELNFEGHRYFDLARYQKIEDVLGVDNTNAVFPIPQREVTATNGALAQNPGF
jgi:starch-binding outer membrane protein, SusD/RagB family